MCGLVGVAGDLALKDEATVQRLLVYDYFRGMDSTGFASVRTFNKEIKVAKVASHPLDLFDMSKFKSACSGSQSSVFMGHNRHATRGVVNAVNAHPFQCGSIVGAHNGTLEIRSVNALEEAMGEKYGTDSEALFAAIDMFGIEATISMIHEGRDSQTGAWSLTWYDQEDDTLNFLRNKHRPMFYAYDKDFKRIFWASEWYMIDHAVKSSISGYELYKDPKGAHFFSTEENVHYKFDIQKLSAGSETRPKPRAGVLKGKEPAPVVSAVSGGPFGRDPIGFHPNTTTPTTRSTTTSHGETHLTKGNEKNIIHLLGGPDDPFAGYITPESFAQLAKHGCSFCYHEISYKQPGLVIFESDDLVICPACAGYNPEDPDSPPNRVYVKGSVLDAMR